MRTSEIQQLVSRFKNCVKFILIKGNKFSSRKKNSVPIRYTSIFTNFPIEAVVVLSTLLVWFWRLNLIKKINEITAPKDSFIIHNW